jgi:hypothetical protein
VGLLILLGACTSPRYDWGDLEARYPVLRSHEDHRLGDLHPYVLPSDGRVVFFLCRWETERPIGVSLPADASVEELAALEDALRSWERAGLGVRFERQRGGPAPITIELLDSAVVTGAGYDTGNATTDCRLPPLATLDARERVRGAQLVASRILIARRTPTDFGKEHQVSPDELRGTALHELGHALGYQGHARSGATVMVRDREAVRRRGAALAGGLPVSDASLRALYALPNGAVLGSASVERWRTDPVDRLAELALENELEGPFARVGETAARLFWRDGAGVEYGVLVANLLEALSSPDEVLPIPETRTRRKLGAGAGERPE